MENDMKIQAIIPANGWLVRFMDTNEEEFTQPVAVWGLLESGQTVGFCAYGRDGLVRCDGKFDDGRQFVGYVEDTVTISVGEFFVDDLAGEVPEPVDPVQRFIDECCDLGAAEFAPVSDVYAAYKRHCGKHGFDTMHSRSLVIDLRERGFEIGVKRLEARQIVVKAESFEGTASTRVFWGLRLKPWVRVEIDPQFKLD